MRTKLLALTLALLMLVTAIPAGAIGMVAVETADEVSEVVAEAATEAEVMANKAGEWHPGLNFFTNSTTAEDFESYSATEYKLEKFDSSVDTAIYTRPDSKLRIVSDPTNNNHGNVLDIRRQMDEFGNLFALADTPFKRPGYLYFIAAQEYNDRSKETGNENNDDTTEYTFYVYNNIGSNSNTHYGANLAGVANYETNAWGYVEASHAERYFGYNNVNGTTTTNFSIGIRHGSNDCTSDDGMASMYYDNLVFVPYYKATYKNIGPDGTALGEDIVKYFLADTNALSVDYNSTTGKYDINGLPTAYTVDSSNKLAVSGYTFMGWTTTQGSTQAATSVELNNEDIELYPIWKYNWMPGKNVYTGNLLVQTFSDTTSPVTSQKVVDSLVSQMEGLTLSTATDDVDAEGHGTVVKETYIGPANTYPTFYTNVEPSLSRPAFFSMDYRIPFETAAENNGFMLGLRRQSTGSTNIVVGFNKKETWQNVSINDGDIFWSNNNTTLLRFQMKYNEGTAEKPLHAYFDNFVMVPWYKITYKNVDPNGNSLGEDEAIYFIAENPASVKVENGAVTGVATSYSVDSEKTPSAVAGFKAIGWTDTLGGTTPVETVALNGDVTLYPVWEEYVYEEVDISFKNAGGDYFDYSGTTEESKYTFPTANELGIGYEPLYTDPNGKTYFPGQTATYIEDTEITVSKSNVIYASNNESVNPYYAVDGGENAVVANSAFLTGWNKTKSDTQTLVSGIDLKHAGVYTFTVDIHQNEDIPEGTTVYINLQDPCGWNQIGGNVYFSNTVKDITVTGKIYVYQNADGSFYYKRSSENGATVNVTSSNESQFHRFKIGFCINNNTSNKSFTWLIDDIKIEYEPLAPENTGLASYRAPDETFYEAGIRFASYVSAWQREKATEYGWVVTRKTLLDNGDGTYAYENLYLDNDVTVTANTISDINAAGVKVVAAAAYIDGSVDKIYAQDGKDLHKSLTGLYDTFFTGVLHGIDANSDTQKSEVFVARPYIKVGGIYYYGDTHETSYNEVYAKANS